MNEFRSGSPQATRGLGQALGRRLFPGAVVALRGPLGAGKTVLAQGIATGLGVEVPVQSPSFILIAEHPIPDGATLYHVDLYRLEDPAEILDLGLEEILWGQGIAVIEWADRLPPASLPPERLDVELRIEGAARRLVLEPRGDRYGRLVRLALRAARGDGGADPPARYNPRP